MEQPLARRLLAEYVGSLLLAALVIGSANPAITIGRVFSDSFAGIAPSGVPLFVLAQLAGGCLAFGLLHTLYPKRRA